MKSKVIFPYSCSILVILSHCKGWLFFFVRLPGTVSPILQCPDPGTPWSFNSRYIWSFFSCQTLAGAEFIIQNRQKSKLLCKGDATHCHINKTQLMFSGMLHTLYAVTAPFFMCKVTKNASTDSLLIGWLIIVVAQLNYVTCVFCMLSSRKRSLSLQVTKKNHESWFKILISRWTFFLVTVYLPLTIAMPHPLYFSPCFFH